MNTNPNKTSPDDCEIVDAGRALKLIWSDGQTHLLEASLLWSQCPSAAGRRRRMDGILHPQSPDLRITKLDRIGRYAVNIGFSDGHDRGVYPWSLLADFAARLTVNDFIMTSAETTGDGVGSTP
ncbi:MAG: DUF971 domain-containing protein [Hyphomicrobiaceae bacterium]